MKYENRTLPIARLVQCSSKCMASCMQLDTNIRSASTSSPCHSQQLTLYMLVNHVTCTSTLDNMSSQQDFHQCVVPGLPKSTHWRSFPQWHKDFHQCVVLFQDFPSLHTEGLFHNDTKISTSVLFSSRTFQGYTLTEDLRQFIEMRWDNSKEIADDGKNTGVYFFYKKLQLVCKILARHQERHRAW